MRRLLLWALAICTAALAQKPEYGFYDEFRSEISVRFLRENPSITPEQSRARYRELLKTQGVDAAEIARRLDLLANSRNALEADYWNRFYLRADTPYNREPNGFLVEVVKGMPPGTALDYAMGEGRNALYLAKLGWKVAGFDPADAAVALAQKRARERGLVLDTAAVRDSEYEFGKDRFDLILFSWSMPLVPIERVVNSLKPGGIVVMECAVDFVGRNGMLKMFDALRIERYGIVKAKADFYARREVEVLRLVARKR